MACEDVDGRADLYSWGAVAHDLLTRRPPFSGSNGVQLLDAHATREVIALSSLCPEIPDDLESIVLKWLAKAPADRHTDDVDHEKYWHIVSSPVPGHRNVHQPGRQSIPQIRCPSKRSRHRRPQQICVVPQWPAHPTRLPATTTIQRVEQWKFSVE